MLFHSLLTTAVALIGSASATLPPIEIVGNKFYFSNNGSQFLMRGIAYQQNPTNTSSDAKYVDPLADIETCKRDIPYLRQLNTNILRVYALDAEKDHTECMKLLDDAGIYIVADLSEPNLSIDRSNPAWDTELLARYTSVVDKFSNYTNVLGFFAGNEVTNESNNTDASAYVKAAVRDTKAYIKEKNYRNIPVGYSANDDMAIRVELADYFACGSDEDRADFFGINMYEWCGTSTFKDSGYKNVTNAYKDLGIPIFFSEYGCNEIRPRKFQEVGTLYSSEMTDIWSGGIVYMYFEEENKYGLVTVSGSSVSTLKDFENYSSEINKISPSYASFDTAASTSPASVTSCPGVGEVWQAATALPPTPDASLCECMDKSLSCVVKDKVDEDDYSDLFDFLCGSDGVNCFGISGNGTTGKYGAYSACKSKQKLNFLLDLYYKENGSKASACDFSGSATTQSAATASSCAKEISEAGVSGYGTVTGNILNAASGAQSATSGSGSKSSGSGSGSRSGSSSGSSSSSTSSSDSGASGNVAMRGSSGNTALVMIATFFFVSVGLTMA
ncbi:hypothetical protein FT663_04544 [Candidozyma haemuli var. vulneris]|uniref:1,3-beta-glucanosyltransferase n=1 Tax=Candidozyma haemuli TaxID=45357 RepID=A0A2V1AU73_9ASCO|nr:hypothetical protein CXQ85_000352 [[Candida] haemuloni]KAF3986401.1 hypothetical protein FT662_04590 [[Candida] haemuloni var. vulneris]KAF3987237.1 hypothetical protein FT663_04544 [[Candida] haemuloni var. vulneris]PVH21375.1 hypothetical protein CXQ85_000352 [[Candida] haemuloni]